MFKKAKVVSVEVLLVGGLVERFPVGNVVGCVGWTFLEQTEFVGTFEGDGCVVEV